MATRRTWLATGLLALLAACTDSPTEPTEVLQTSDEVVAAHGGRGHPHGAKIRHHSVKSWLARLRRTTAPYRDLRRAMRAGYDTMLTECMESDAGGMGVHYGNVALIDAVVQEQAPEVLLYEPGRRGKMRLVAVEYVVPFTAWTEPEPPELNGVSFHRNEDFGLWVLHAWAWKTNPTGALQDWNPRVSCRFAD